MNLLAGKPADRVPVAFFHHFCPPNERGKGLENQETFERSVIGRKLARKKFGPDAIKIMNGTLMMIPADEEHFNVNVDVRVSRQFLGWVFSLGSDIQIVGPDDVVEQMRKEIARSVEQYRT